MFIFVAMLQPFTGLLSSTGGVGAGRHERRRRQVYGAGSRYTEHAKPLAAQKVGNRVGGLHLSLGYALQGNNVVFVEAYAFAVLQILDNGLAYGVEKHGGPALYALQHKAHAACKAGNRELGAYVYLCARPYVYAAMAYYRLAVKLYGQNAALTAYAHGAGLTVGVEQSEYEQRLARKFCAEYSAQSRPVKNGFFFDPVVQIYYGTAFAVKLFARSQGNFEILNKLSY